MLAPLCIVGARPNFVKIAPLLRELDARGLPHRLVHTGQHFDERMAGAFFEGLGIGRPDVDLGVGAGTHAEQTARVMERFDAVAADAPAGTPVVVVGDVNSTVACALVAAKRGLPVVHVEAGLRSFDRFMPEEVNRVVTDHLSHLCLAPSGDAVENLAREGIGDERVRLVGNIMIDTLLRELPAARAGGVVERLGLQGRDYVLVTLHRPSNVDDGVRLSALAEMLGRLAGRMAVVFPVHPRTAARLRAQGAYAALGDVTLTEPLAYHDCVALMERARLVVTDSGGIQEETTVLGVPCLTVRDSTERPITIAQGTNRLAGTDVPRVRAIIEELLAASRQASPRRPPLWDGRTSVRIVDALLPMLQVQQPAHCEPALSHAWNLRTSGTSDVSVK